MIWSNVNYFFDCDLLVTDKTALVVLLTALDSRNVDLVSLQ